jgi:hypothetical protein
VLSPKPRRPQAPAAPAQTAAPVDKNQPELATKEAPAVFKAREWTWCRYRSWCAIPRATSLDTLTKENFQVFDNGKPQEIIRFSLEKTGDLAAKAAKTVDAARYRRRAGAAEPTSRNGLSPICSTTYTRRWESWCRRGRPSANNC